LTICKTNLLFRNQPQVLHITSSNWLAARTPLG
jgi:hypothetical protein